MLKMKPVTLVRAAERNWSTLLLIERSVSGTKLYHATVNRAEFEKEFENDIRYLVGCGVDTVGMVMYKKRTSAITHISALAIKPQWQGRGVGRAIMSFLLQKLAGIPQLEVVVHPENTRAVNLYQSLGFEIAARHENYFGDGEPRVLFVKLNKGVKKHISATLRPKRTVVL